MSAVLPVAGWPVVLQRGLLRLRPIRRTDAADLRRVQLRNRAWLGPWEATSPDPRMVMSYGGAVRVFRREAREGRMLPFVLEVDGLVRGQVNVSNITWGSTRNGAVGYWIDEEVAGHGYMPLAVALVVDHCLGPVGLHRIEAAVRPENGPSLAVMRKLGMREEGLRLRYIHIDGQWRDHRTFAVTAEELPPGGLESRVAGTTGRHTTDLHGRAPGRS